MSGGRPGRQPRNDPAAKVSRLRAGEPKADDVAGPACDSDLDTLGSLRRLDERVEAAGYPPILDVTDRRIVDAGLTEGRINCATLSAALGVHRSTVWRRVQHLLATAPELYRYGRTLLKGAEETSLRDPKEWRAVKAMAKTYAWGGIGERPAGALDLDAYEKLAAMFRAGAAARRLRYPPPTGLTLDRQGEKLVITGPGPLPQDLQEAVRAGKAERIFPGPPRCHACGRYVSQASTGRPRKYCSERCRTRYRRQS